jgi:hypothetical protein
MTTPPLSVKVRCSRCGSVSPASEALLCARTGQEVFCKERHAAQFWDAVELLSELSSQLIDRAMYLHTGAATYSTGPMPLSDSLYSTLVDQFEKNKLYLDEDFSEALSGVLARRVERSKPFGQDIRAELCELQDPVSIGMLFPSRPRGPCSFFTLHLVADGGKNFSSASIYRAMLAMERDRPIRVYPTTTTPRGIQ